MRYVGGPYDWPTRDTSIQEVVAAKPEYIFQNHTHYDQMHQATDLTITAGAKLIGTVQHCDVTKRGAMQRGMDPGKVQCIFVQDPEGKPFSYFDSYFLYGADEGAIGSTPYGTFGTLPEEIPGLEVTALMSKHTQWRPNYQNDEGYADPCLDCYDVREAYVEPTYEGYTSHPEKPQNVPYQAVNSPPPGDIEGGNVAYLIKYGDFSMVIHGGSGPLNPSEPGEAEIRRGLQTFSTTYDQVDVELGTIVETQAFAQGLVDAARYAREIKAKVFFPMHHNNWGSLSAGRAIRSYTPFMKEMNKIPEDARPDVCYTIEDNMHTAWSFDVSEWVGANQPAMKPLGGPDCYAGPGLSGS
jgi:hypothetical protein